MAFTSILFNPTLRGNVLQLLLLSLTLPVNLVITPFSRDNASVKSLILVIGGAFFILVHHVASLFLSRFAGVIIVDWLLLAAEIAGVGFAISRPISGSLPGLLALPTLIALILMMLFRTATILASPDRLWEQKLEFWGGCRATHRSPWTVLFNRPLGKVLVRGESVFAIVLRCVILAGIGIGLPTLAINKIFFQPSQATVFSRAVSQYSTGNLNPDLIGTSISGNAVLIMPQTEFQTPLSVSVTTASSLSNCSTAGTTLQTPPQLPTGAVENQYMVATCPYSWQEIGRMTVSITFPQGFNAPNGIYPGVGDANDIIAFTQPVPVLEDFNLFAYMTWTSRQIVSTRPGFLSLFNALLPGRKVQVMEVHSLLSGLTPPTVATLTTPSAPIDTPSQPPGPTGPPPPPPPGPLAPRDEETTTTVTITIVQREPFATKFVQDYTDTTALDGLSSIGGLWTTLDAIFTLVFGASVLYFAFGKRPLSPLGIVHIFQRRTLTRNWHEDFPAVHTEGGEPGSDNAGVVAFLRDRWLDIAEEDDQDAYKGKGRDEKGEEIAGPWV
ncbi:hypothetical protein DFH06DRAFT_616215 [Mycena polygramma]|nr:hypothetical protein DFH06DRAFT_616215 [Mycena polygramma]